MSDTNSNYEYFNSGSTKILLDTLNSFDEITEIELALLSKESALKGTHSPHSVEAAMQSISSLNSSIATLKSILKSC